MSSDRDDFISQRVRGIGASEAAAACGVSPWKTPYQLYLEKRGEGEAVEETEDMEFGTIIEPSIARLYERRHGVSLRYPLPTCVHPDPTYPFVIATGDAEESESVGVELKSMSYFRAAQVDEFGLAEVVPEYLCQAQQQMAIMGWEVVKLVALVERKLKVWEIPRDDELIDMILERETDLWRRILAGDPPPVDVTSEDALKDVRRRFKTVGCEYVKLSAGAAEAWRRRQDVGEQIKALEKQRDGDLASVLLEIGDAAGGVLPGDCKVVKRIQIAATQVSYERKAHIQTRECKWSGGNLRGVPVVESLEAEESPEVVASKLDSRLRCEGFLCHHVSPSGSRYYIHADHDVRVRVSDHDPTTKTLQWREKTGAMDLRTDRRLAEVRAVLDHVLSMKGEVCNVE
jgi:putative phage-type endonuclease